MKNCYSCNQILSLEMFGKNKSKPSGLADECKKCKSELDKNYREVNKNKIKQQRHEYYLCNKEQIIDKTCEYSKNNRVKCRAWCTKAKNKLKLETFTYYCNGEPICKNCSEKEIDILTVDHIDGNGNTHRKEIGLDCKGGYNFYRWLKKNQYPEGFQILCYNCQFRKRMIEMKPENPTHLQLVRANYARKVKIQCLENYGGCVCQCGESDIEVLTLDHVENNGAEHRRETNARGYSFYIMLRKNNFPNDYPLQTLCMNCQIKKRNIEYEQGKIRQAIDSNASTIVT